MSARREHGPETMRSPETGELLHRDVRPFTVAYKGERITVALPGFYPDGSGDGVHVGRDMEIIDAAIRDIEEKAAGRMSSEST